jgi:hypothetical protein
VAWLVFSIIGAGAFDGFTKVNIFISNGMGFLVFLCILESVLYIVDFVLGIYCVYRAHTFRQRGDNL